MDGQHQYEINLKKDDLFICLSSDDVYFISKQMDKWFGILLDDSYVPVSMPQRPPAPATAESVPVQPASVLPSPEPVAVAQPQPEVAPQPEPAGGFIHPSQAQVPQAQSVPSAEANDLLAQQLLMQQQIAAQQQTILAQQAALQAQQAIPQPIPQPLPQPQPTLQDVLQQVGQPNLPDFVNQQPALQQPSVLSAMPAQPAFQDVNLPMAQPALIQQAVQQPMPQSSPQPIPQPIAQPLPEAPLHTEAPMLQAVPQPEVQAPPQPMMQAPPQVPAESALPLDVAEVAAQPIPRPIPQPVPELAAVGAPSLVPTGEQDDFEAVMNSLLRDFEDKPSQTPGFAAEAAATKGAPRERIEPDLSGVTSLADLCDRSNASNSEDYLLLSAYYLSRMERQDTFSLKKVNSVLVKSGLTPVNHSVLETVLTNGYLSMLPDLTGMAEVTEYQISAEGIEAAIALL